MLHKETNFYFLNPHTNKIDLKIFTKYLLEKDEHANFELSNYAFNNSNYLDNQLLSYNYLSTDTSNESSSLEEKTPKNK